MDVFLSTVSNRLNIVMKQLAVIATILAILLFVVFQGDASYVELTASARASLGIVLAAVLALPTLALVGRRRLWLWLAFALWLAPLPPLIFPPLGRTLGVS